MLNIDRSKQTALK